MEKAQQRYFRVVGCTSQAADQLILLFWDLNERQLSKQFLTPYRTGGRLVIGQKHVNVSDLVAIKIIETPQSKNETLKELQEKSLKAIEQRSALSVWPTAETLAYGWNDEDIVYAERDVTERYITGGPGSSSWPRRVLHSRRLLIVGGALALLAVSAWIDA
ncbi:MULTISPECIES: hypothetical protein [unclassified Ensifer]|uniref:hypothetical protein n=1 Tax=unclassified Ensifer TaxID=2633371 RepID=UPI0008135C9E|nr:MULTISPECIES: hypothetical protein [unclassified Ensifer]OCO98856.1 hypothetical protein BC362_28120 [Ensifer sp. LC14]OCP02646.1 hypothetical protein BBX50_27535 [Ensifer sp. LC11]OCP02980.1 hypothetical protein BC374_27545 [Ensifer sp. LC13]OCP29911.1 hypothetical protein BC364_27650 [Ensifer sp. LC499]